MSKKIRQAGVAVALALLLMATGVASPAWAKVFAGTAEVDQIYGTRGDDTIEGSYGNDRLVGGRGYDEIEGGYGNDRLEAADGRYDFVGCGPGYDYASVDSHDYLDGCEVVNGEPVETSTGA